MLRLIKKVLYFSWLKYKWNKKCIFDMSSYISPSSTFEGANKVSKKCIFNGSLGYGSYMGPYCNIEAEIGRFTSIAPYVRTNSGVHPFQWPYATTCPMFYSTSKQNGYTFADKMLFDEIRDPVKIGNDCWIGENVFIVGGCVIGDGAIVLAGAVVTKDVPPYSVVGGVPAKVLKYRYDLNTIEKLIRFKWWNKDISWLSENWKLLCNIDDLLRS